MANVVEVASTPAASVVAAPSMKVKVELNAATTILLSIPRATTVGALLSTAIARAKTMGIIIPPQTYIATEESVILWKEDTIGDLVDDGSKLRCIQVKPADTVAPTDSVAPMDTDEESSSTSTAAVGGGGAAAIVKTANPDVHFRFTDSHSPGIVVSADGMTATSSGGGGFVRTDLMLAKGEAAFVEVFVSKTCGKGADKRPAEDHEYGHMTDIIGLEGDKSTTDLDDISYKDCAGVLCCDAGCGLHFLGTSITFGPSYHPSKEQSAASTERKRHFGMLVDLRDAGAVNGGRSPRVIWTLAGFPTPDVYAPGGVATMTAWDGYANLINPGRLYAKLPARVFIVVAGGSTVTLKKAVKLDAGDSTASAFTHESKPVKWSKAPSA